MAGTQTGTKGGGWKRTSGTLEFEQYYIAEWRNFSGFDDGLRYAYATRWAGADGARTVDFTPYNAPGLLLWYRDSDLLEQRRGATTCPSRRASGPRAPSSSSTRTRTRTTTTAPPRRRTRA